MTDARLALLPARTAVAKAAEWLMVPKHNGPLLELKGFMLAWCEANGFATEG